MSAILPLTETPVLPPCAPAATGSAPAQARRILLLDDDAATRRVQALVLARAGYSVDTAEDGELGWDALCVAHYDLLVTDNDMPRLTGLRLVERLRFAGLALPVIIASGSLDLGEAKDYSWLALAAILHKPFSFEELVSAVREAAPITPAAGEGAVHDLQRQRDNSPRFPFPARPGVFAETV